jgi:hypothetical protein
VSEAFAARYAAAILAGTDPDRLCPGCAGRDFRLTRQEPGGARQPWTRHTCWFLWCRECGARYPVHRPDGNLTDLARRFVLDPGPGGA